MVLYVWAVHDFIPEHEDEIEFHTGERIEVVERDELYSDGWWQGKNVAGKTGLFPQSYTSPTPPDAPMSARTPTVATALQPLQEAEEPPEPQSERDERHSGVMTATMTDVQAAIDQLGINRTRSGDDTDNDAARSFSFASTKEESDDQLSDIADSEDHDHDDSWRVDARRALAERAMREMERREKAEAATSLPRTAIPPPIEAEISDESDAEDDHEHAHHPRLSALNHSEAVGTPRAVHYPDPIPTTAAPVEPATPPRQRSPSRVPAPPRAVSPVQSEQSIPAPAPVPAAHSRDASALSIPTPSSDTSPSPRGSAISQPTTVVSSITAAAAMPLPASPAPEEQQQRISAARTSGGFAPLQAKPSRPGSGTTTRTQSFTGTPQQQPRQLNDRTSTDITAALPSPAASSFDANGGRYSSSVPRSSTMATSLSAASGQSMFAGVHPSEWNVEQVVAWLRSKGFDEGVCSKFIEHEITGDVLIDLDANLLKEIDIVQFGKRMRIANAIHELNRPPSIVSSENSGSRLAQQQHQQSISMHSSVRQSSGSGPTPLTTGPSPLVTSLTSPESPPHSGDLVFTPETRIRPESEPGPSILGHAATMPASIGLGFTQPKRSDSVRSNGKPPTLSLSPSDSALNKRAALADQILEELNEDRVHDERAVMSEGETAEGLEARTNKRRNKQSDPPPSASTVGSGPRSDGGSHKAKNSIDNNTARPAEPSSGGRLSFFGGTLGNKSRKPPPRVGSSDDHGEEKNRTLSRLQFGVGSKRPSSRLDTSPKDATSLAPSATLRKRANSQGDTNASTRGKVNLKPGMSIVDQIGEADYSGWMRKRGERYNTWKLRYFVLKGPHLYYLRSRNETKLKGYINIVGYKVIADENANPGRYGFRIVHETDKPHYFSSEEQMVVREWMKSIMKATIDRDYTRPVISSCNIPTIPLSIAQAMNPAPRPPSPAQREATQRAMRRENPNQLSTRDARVLMGLPSTGVEPPPNQKPVEERKRLESFFSVESGSTGREALTPPVSPTAPPRPKRDSRKPHRTSIDPQTTTGATVVSPEDAELVKWVNSHLPSELQVSDLSQSLSTGLVLFRLSEAIKGRSLGVPDSVFPTGPNDERLEGLFKLFDFMLDNDIRTGNVSINDVRQGRRDKIVLLLKSLKGWEDKRLAIAKSVGVGAVVAGPWAA